MGAFSELGGLTAPRSTGPASQDDPAGLANTSTGAGNAFTKSLRSGFTRMGGDADAYVGAGAEAAGNTEFAQAQYAKAKAASALADTQNPNPMTYQQVLDSPDVGAGLRNAGTYVAGLAGGSAPYLLPMAGGALAARFGGGKALAQGVAAATASTPFHAGEAIQRQQDDPVAMQQSAGNRFVNATGVGVVNSALDSAAPMYAGAKLFGKAARTAVRTGGVLPTVGKAVAADAAIEGTTEGGQEVMQQQGLRLLNPDRDTSGDRQAIIDNAVGGAVLGGVLGGAHGAADMRRPTSRDPNGAPAQSLTERLKGMAETVAGKTKSLASPVNLDERTQAPLAAAVNLDEVAKTNSKAPKNLDEAIDRIMPKPATGDDFARAMNLDNLPPEQQAAGLQEADTRAADNATLNASLASIGLKQRTDLSPEDRSWLDSVDPGDPANHSGIKDLNINYAAKDRAAKKADDLAKSAGISLPSEGAKLSAERTKPGRSLAAYEPFNTPEWADFSDRTKEIVSQVMPKLSAEPSDSTLMHLARTLGDNAAPLLRNAIGQLSSGDLVKREALYKSSVRMEAIQQREAALTSAIRDALPPEHSDGLLNGDVQDFSDYLKQHIRSEIDAKTAPFESQAQQAEMDRSLKRIFGGKASAVLNTFRAAVKKEATPFAGENYKKEMAQSERRTSQNAGRGSMDAQDKPVNLMNVAEDQANAVENMDADATNSSAGDLNPRIHDTGGEIPFMVNTADGTWEPERVPKFVERKDVSNAAYGGGLENTGHTAAEKRAQEAFPDHKIGWKTAEEYAKESNMPRADLMKLTKNRPQDYGLVTTQGSEVSDKLSDQDVNNMLFDRKFMRDDGVVSGSQLDAWVPKNTDAETGKVTEGHNIALDGFKIVGAMQKKVGYSATEKSGLAQTRAMFEQGIAALVERHGIAFDQKDLLAVQVTGGGKGKTALTYGDLLNLHDGDLNPADAARVKKLRATPENASRETRLKAKGEIASIHDDTGVSESGRAKIDALRMHDSNLRSAMEQAAATDGDTAGWKEMRTARTRIYEQIKDIQDKFQSTVTDRFHDDMTTNDRAAEIGKMEGELSEAWIDVRKYERMQKKRGNLTTDQQGALDNAKDITNEFPTIIFAQEKLIERIGDYATFSEAKGITSEYGTGRDIGKGITKIDDLLLDRKKSLSLLMADVHRLVSEGDTAKASKAIAEFDAQAHKHAIAGGGVSQFSDIANAAKVVLQGADAVGAFRKGLHNDIRMRTKTAADVVTLGVSQIDPQGQIHMAKAEHGEDKILLKQGTDGSYLLDYPKKDSDTGPQNAAAKMEARVNLLVKNAAAEVDAKGKKIPKLVRDMRMKAAARAVELVNQFDKIPAFLKDASRRNPQSEVLAAIMKGRDIAPVMSEINKLADEFAKVEKVSTRSQAKVIRDWVAHIATGDWDIAAVNRSNDVARLQGAAAVLSSVPNKPRKLGTKPSSDKSVDAVDHTKVYLDAVNARISSLLGSPENADGDLAYKMMTGWKKPSPRDSKTSREDTGVSGPATEAEMGDVVKLIKTMLGDSVDIDVERDLGSAGVRYSGDYTSDAMAKAMLRVSVNALNPQSTAYHESLHAFFGQMAEEPAHQKVLAVLRKAASDPRLRDVLRGHFAGQEAVLSQLEESVEERAAYMFQLYATNDPAVMSALSMGSKNVIQRWFDALKKVMGIWTNHERAMHIMDYFKDGKYAENQGNLKAVADAALLPGRNATIDRIVHNITPLRNLAASVITVGSQRVYDMEIPAFNDLIDLVKLRSYTEGKDPGALRAAGVESTRQRNIFSRDLHAIGATNQDWDAALSALRLDTRAALVGKQAEVAALFDKTFGRAFDFMREAGVDVGRLSLDGKYAPRVWSVSYISKNTDEFRAMLQKYVDAGKMQKDSVESIIGKLMGSDGSDILTDTVDRPGNEFVKERILKFISAADAEQFVEKDSLQTVSHYIGQAVKRAEWARRFGDKTMPTIDEYGKTVPGVIDENAKYKTFMAEAVKQGATEQQVETVERYMAGVHGTLGENLSPNARRWMSNIMIYQNMRLLPMGIFSGMIDANGIKVNGGTYKDVFKAFSRGIKEVSLNFRKTTGRNGDYELAEYVGAIDSVALHHALGGATYGMMHASPWLRKANNKLFQYNGMEQWNTSMRVSGVQAALGFFARHADGKATDHSMRFLAEAGLRPADVVLGETGNPLVTQQEFMDYGLEPEAAAAASNKMVFAINKWVDGAILRPDATLKTIWMNDPLYAIFGHMKQFTFAFQETTLKRVAHEMGHGNYGPLAAMGSYIPVMLAADMVKSMLQGAGELPEWQKNWDLMDFLERAVQRAGLFGVGQIGIDTVKSLRHGGWGIGPMAGPTMNQASDLIGLVGGKGEFAEKAFDAMPGSSAVPFLSPDSSVDSGDSLGLAPWVPKGI